MPRNQAPREVGGQAELDSSSNSGRAEIVDT